MQTFKETFFCHYIYGTPKVTIRTFHKSGILR